MTHKRIVMCIEDIAEGMGDAPFGSNLKNTHYTESGALVVQGKNVQGRSFDWADKRHVSIEKWASIPRSHCRPGDLIFPKVGTIGKVGILSKCIGYENYLLSTNTMRLRVDNEKANPLYIYYFFTAQSTVNLIHALNSKSVQPVFNFTTLKKFKVELPTLSEQKAIAHILGTLDDKIELNRQMNTTLESMAQALFKSWFVDFDPVIDKALAAGNPIPEPLLKKAEVRKTLGDERKPLPADVAKHFPDRFVFTEEMGWVPEGWEVSNVGNIATNVRDTIAPDSLAEQIPYVGLEHIDKKSFSLTRWGYAADVDSQKSKFGKDDFLFGKLRPYFHKVCQVHDEGICSTDILVLRPKIKSFSGFVGCQLFEPEFVEYANVRSTGTRMPRANWKDMAEYGIVLPNIQLIEVFDRRIKVSRDKSKRTVIENMTLTSLRDSLLPKLLSGELRIPAAEKLIAKI